MTASVAYLGDVTHHFWLTRSVARAMDLSLAEALDSGFLSAADYSGMVTRCRMCPLVSKCETWLGRNGACATSAPDHCVNAGQFNSLAVQLGTKQGGRTGNA